MTWVLLAVAVGGFGLAFVTWRGSGQASRLQAVGLAPAPPSAPAPAAAQSALAAPNAPAAPAARPPFSRGLANKFRTKRPPDQTLEAFVLLDADVRAGIAPSSALLHALQSISLDFLPQTQTACVTGIDIAQALKREATANGQTATTNSQKTTPNSQSAWSLLAACWAVSDKYGASLSSMLQEVIGVCRRNHRATQQLKAQLAAPVAGAKLLAGLPALGLGLGFLLGANPIVWLLGNPIGWVVAAVAIAFEVAGVFWVRRIMRGATNPKRFSEIDAAATACQLIAALLKSGVTLLIAIEVAAEAISGPSSQRLSLVANRLRLGADPALAWGELTEDENLRLLAKVLIRSSQTGAPGYQSLVSVVEAARDQLASSLEARARSAGVHAVAPLALCFLPAFLLVTVVPIVGSLLPTVLQLPSG